MISSPGSASGDTESGISRKIRDGLGHENYSGVEKKTSLSTLFIPRNDKPLLTSSWELHKDVEPIIAISGWTLPEIRNGLQVRQLLSAFIVLVD
jgi:hypothetical protein